MPRPLQAGLIIDSSHVDMTECRALYLVFSVCTMELSCLSLYRREDDRDDVFPTARIFPLPDSVRRAPSYSDKGRDTGGRKGVEKKKKKKRKKFKSIRQMDRIHKDALYPDSEETSRCPVCDQ